MASSKIPPQFIHSCVPTQVGVSYRAAERNLSKHVTKNVGTAFEHAYRELLESTTLTKAFV